MMRDQVTRYIDTPFTWAVVGFIVGLMLGVTLISVWLVAIGFGAFLLYLRLHGPAEEPAEGRLFAAGPAFMMSWALGFVVRSFVF